jgi:predicted ArsR family transcriptional regulator
VQPIRRRITEIIKDNGEATVAELAEKLGMAQVSVRHHLDILSGEGLVTYGGFRRHNGAGRPSQVYRLTETARRLFPQRHDILAAEMLGELKALLPPEQVHELLQRLGENASRDAPAGGRGQTMEERLSQVAQFLTEKGYNARWERGEGAYEIHTCNCPYVGVSNTHPELCAMDQAMMRQLLPGAIRLETQAMDGALHCRYLIAAGDAACKP